MAYRRRPLGHPAGYEMRNRINIGYTYHFFLNYDSLTYLWNIVSKNVKCEKEIKVRIAMAKQAFTLLRIDEQRVEEEIN